MAVVAASPLQARVLGLAAPYLTPLQLRIDGRPLYLTHGSPADQTHRVEWLREDSDTWEREAAAGYQGSERQRRYSRFAKVIAAAAEREETAAASLLALPLVRRAMQDAVDQELPPPVRMRIVRLAPDAAIRTYPSAPVAIPSWEAAIVPEPPAPDGTPQWSLVTIKERRLNAEPLTSDSSDSSGSPRTSEGESETGNAPEAP
ncbi:hypothetical protein [Candidatus Laterigemmans baculatus]|uniref:hypothetical protein n=1 Tax=Candidatus Laterigemmans baculatus TaxID=2770505 RepID=UPI00193C1D1B|nr:hypothetical protein [Candidatus Laterigemmans baculatus]